MNFGKNLQKFRKARGLSQEELAEKMGVSRQAIGKWESGGGYPEAEKLIELSEVLGCSMDALVRGEADESKDGATRSGSSDLSAVTDTPVKAEYVRLMNKFSKWIAVAIGLILLGVTGLVAMSSFGEYYADYGVVLMLGFVMVSVPIFVVRGMEMGSFKEKHSKLEEFFDAEEIESYNQKFSLMVAGAVSVILAGLVVFMMLIVTNVLGEFEALASAVFLMFVSVAVPILVYAGIQKGKYNIAHYNRENSEEFKIDQARAGAYGGVIMLFAAIIFLVLGVMADAWEWCWIAFPIGGLLCGIISLILGPDQGRRK